MSAKDFVIITGLSGAGKSTALKNLEALNYFCVDNLPPLLLPKFAQLCDSSGCDRVAVAVDDTGENFRRDIQEAMKTLPQLSFKPQIVFFDSPDDVLVRRFSASYHRHPMGRGGRVIDAIKKERTRLEEIRGIADRIIDTGDMSPAKLREEITRQFFDWNEGEKPITVTVVSFGYKYGIPRDVDVLFDARILPNPYYDTELRPMDGRSEKIQDYVFARQESKSFLDRIFDFVGFILPHYVSMGKSHLTIAVGCTGGRHRSVAVADRLVGFLISQRYSVSQDHRDIAR